MSCLFAEKNVCWKYFFQFSWYLCNCPSARRALKFNSECAGCTTALTQPRPSRGFYVIRTFYSWCKQSSTCSTSFWTGDGALQPPSPGAGGATLRSMRRSSDAARKEVRWYHIATITEGLPTSLYELKVWKGFQIDCLNVWWSDWSSHRWRITTFEHF